MKMHEIMRLVESNLAFTDHLQDAVEASGAGWHFEEGGCWGMALALYDAFKSLGEHPQLMLQTDDFTHALVLVGGQLFDYNGAVVHNPPGARIRGAGLMRAALKGGQ